MAGSAAFRRLPATSTRFAGSSACGWMNRTVSGWMPVAMPRANISGMRYEGQTIANLPRGDRYLSAAAYTSAIMQATSWRAISFRGSGFLLPSPIFRYGGLETTRSNDRGASAGMSSRKSPRTAERRPPKPFSSMFRQANSHNAGWISPPPPCRNLLHLAARRRRTTPDPVPRSRADPPQSRAAKSASRTESMENRYPFSGWWIRMDGIAPSLSRQRFISPNGEDQETRQDLRIEEGGLLGENVAGEGDVPELAHRDGVEEKRRLELAPLQVGYGLAGLLVITDELSRRDRFRGDPATLLEEKAVQEHHIEGAKFGGEPGQVLLAERAASGNETMWNLPPPALQAIAFPFLPAPSIALNASSGVAGRVSTGRWDLTRETKSSSDNPGTEWIPLWVGRITIPSSSMLHRNMRTRSEEH